MAHFLETCDVMMFHYDIRPKRTRESLKKDGYSEQIMERRQGEPGREILENMTECEQMEFFGEFYSDKFVNEMAGEFERLKIKVKNGFCYIEDISGQVFNFVDGHRVTVGQPCNAQRKIFVFGPCIAGAYVEDSAMICSYMQKALIQRGFSNYKVENCGIGLGVPAWMDCIFKESYSKGDVVVLLDDRPEWVKKQKLECMENYKYVGGTR